MKTKALELLREAVPSLNKSPDLLAEMLARPDTFYLKPFKCNVRTFLKRNGIDPDMLTSE